MPRKSPVDHPEVSPCKSVVEELDHLRTALGIAGARYVEALQTAIDGLREVTLQAGPQACGSQVRDLRDMLMLMRGLDLKPEAGRRKDLKKIEAAVEELVVMTKRWK